MLRVELRSPSVILLPSVPARRILYRAGSPPSDGLQEALRNVAGKAWFARACVEVATRCCELLARAATGRDRNRAFRLHTPHTATGVPSNSSLRWKIFSFHGLALRSKITKCPASAPHRSM